MGPWIALALATGAPGGISIDADAIEFSAASAPVCWLAKRRLRHKKDRTRLKRAVVRAGLATRPSHVDHPLKRIRSIQRQGQQLGCAGYVNIMVKGRRAQTRIVVSARRADEASFAEVATIRLKLWTLAREDLEPGWTAAWALLVPPAPPSPPPPPPLAPFVDDDLNEERTVASAPPGLTGASADEPGPPSPPVVSLWVDAGWSSRSLSEAPGADQAAANIMTLGGQVTLHLGPLLSLGAEHALDVDAGYWHRFVEGEQDGRSVSVSSDRTAANLRYRVALARWAPRFGPVIGYELARFESDAAGVLSTRFSVLRAGLGAVQPILRWSSEAGLWASAGSTVRWAPVGDADVGFDVEGAVSVRLDVGLMVRIAGRFFQQAGEADDESFTTRTVEAVAGVGWSL